MARHPYGPFPTEESKGIDRGYRAAHEQARQELEETANGPDKPLAPPTGEGIKNPEREFEEPASMNAPRPRNTGAPGPNEAGNSSGRGDVDPQGQQGGTEGGQPASPSLPNEVHPLAEADARKRRSGYGGGP